MKYQNPTFSSGHNSDAYRDNWERTFGKNRKAEKFLDMAKKAGPFPTSALAAPGIQAQNEAGDVEVDQGKLKRAYELAKKLNKFIAPGSLSDEDNDVLDELLETLRELNE